MTDEPTPDGNDGDRFQFSYRRLRALLRDLLFVATWVTVVSVGWRIPRWPAWAYYVVVFAGIVLYSLATARFARSARHG